MAWDLEAGTGGNSGESKQNFTKFEEGVTFIQLLDNSPHIRWAHWIPKHSRYVTCAGRGCAICEVRNKEKANKQPQSFSVAKRFAINVYNHDTKQVEIMEQGKTFFEDLNELIKESIQEGKAYEELVFKVKRTGSGTDTRYRIDVSRTEKLEPQTTIDLAEFFKPLTVEQSVRIANGEAPADVFKEETEPSEPSDSAEEFQLK